MLAIEHLLLETLDSVLARPERETASAPPRSTVAIDARNLNLAAQNKPGEASKSFPATVRLGRAVCCTKRFHVRVGEPDPVVRDCKSTDVRCAGWGAAWRGQLLNAAHGNGNRSTLRHAFAEAILCRMDAVDDSCEHWIERGAFRNVHATNAPTDVDVHLTRRYVGTFRSRRHSASLVPTHARVHIGHAATLHGTRWTIPRSSIVCTPRTTHRQVTGSTRAIRSHAPKRIDDRASTIAHQRSRINDTTSSANPLQTKRCPRHHVHHTLPTAQRIDPFHLDAAAPGVILHALAFDEDIHAHGDGRGRLCVRAVMSILQRRSRSGASMSGHAGKVVRWLVVRLRSG